MPWFRKDKRRYQVEVRNLKRHHPQARVFIKDGRLIILHKVAGRFDKYLIKVVYPQGFPYAQDWVVKVVKPEIVGAPDQFKNGGLCLFGSSNVGPQTTGKVMVDWSRKWVKAYEQWKVTGRMPSPQQV